MTTNQATKIVSKHEPLVVLATYNILFTNDIVCSQVIESISRLEKSPLYRQRTKQLAKKASDARRAYERLVNGIISDRSTFFADANETFTEEVCKHVDILYYSIKREFDRYRLTDADLLARLETVRTLCDFACQQFDSRMDELRAKDPQFSCFRLDYLRLTDLLRLLNELMRTFRIPCTVDLNTAQCLTAIDVLARKLMDGGSIARAISTSVLVDQDAENL